MSPRLFSVTAAIKRHIFMDNSWMPPLLSLSLRPWHCFHSFSPTSLLIFQPSIFSSLLFPAHCPPFPLPCDTPLLKPYFCSKFRKVEPIGQDTHTHAHARGSAMFNFTYLKTTVVAGGKNLSLMVLWLDEEKTGKQMKKERNDSFCPQIGHEWRDSKSSLLLYCSFPVIRDKWGRTG